MNYYRCFIDGEWTDGSANKRLPVEDPATGESWAEVAVCSTDDVARAIETAAAAQKKWAALTPLARADHIYRICAALADEKDHFARLLVREQGKTLTEAEFEVDDTIRYMTYAAEAARRITGEILPADAPGEQLYIYRAPYGVTIGLCAYNYPLALIGRKVGPALVTGNTMVIKPHEATPVTASEFCRICEKAGLPRGVVNMVNGVGTEVGAALVSHPLTRMVTLTGSIRAGQGVAAAASKNLAALSLELGGKAPFIVLKDADIDAAVEAAAIARYANCGQVCICAESVLVEDAIADEFTDKLMKRVGQVRPGNPMTNAGMGPLTTPGALSRVEDMVARSVAEGGEVVIGGSRPQGAAFERGNWYAPTLVLNAAPHNTLVQEEIFGPVLPVVRVGGWDEALTVANDQPFGLSAYLWTRDAGIYMDAVNRMETGTIFLNKGIVGYVQAYHNGHKLSGLGGEDGTHGLEGYMQKRTVYMKY
ncbi:aldehyde dehydrogenase family protein [Shinella sp. 838]|uniref:aldehyde dehydrogenase family protein n=1 Tax=Shinella sp. 838 TaxID=3038164 RepID=UPI002414D707|nr:aldehyde dehydrogenase family protein [Shinella sp. 838]MDG4674937.1 aldehyde dehydrogenase family protein [Shinella sp. 838]